MQVDQFLEYWTINSLSFPLHDGKHGLQSYGVFVADMVISNINPIKFGREEIISCVPVTKFP
jgi:hypothetical protein